MAKTSAAELSPGWKNAAAEDERHGDASPGTQVLRSACAKESRLYSKAWRCSSGTQESSAGGRRSAPGATPERAPRLRTRAPRRRCP